MKSTSFFHLRDGSLFNRLNERFGGSAPWATVLFCLLCIVTPVVFCLVVVGPETLLEYAGKTKPYSVLLNSSGYEKLSEREDSAKIICFGDSSYFYPPHQNPKAGDEATYLTTLLHEELDKNDEIPDFALSQRAFASAGMFDYYCMIYEAMEVSPDLILIPINWRSFGTDEWDLVGMDWLENSNWYHPELSALVPLANELPPDCKDPLKEQGITAAKQIGYKLSRYTLYPIGMKAWALENAKSLLAAVRANINPSAFAEEQTDASPRKATRPDHAPSKNGAALGKDMSIDYPMTIDMSNTSYQSLAPLAQVASEKGIKVLFFIWPIDQEYFEQLGHLDRKALEKSKRLLAEAVDEENIYFLDLSDLLGHEDFFDISGHCVVEGRRKVAKALTPKVVEIVNENTDLSE